VGRRTSSVPTVDQTVAAADAILADVDLSGDPVEALAVLIGMSWRTLEQFGEALVASHHELSREQVRQALHHVRTRIASLVEDGRSQGRFRTDLPTDWLVTAMVDLIHAAAADVGAGRLAADQVGWVVASTVTQALAPDAPGPAR
jgi:TetR/AcrR family transcriptional regulator, mexCD-oprJ operon repressor